MDFENSSQARSWLFDSVTLAQCRQKALSEKPKATARSSVDRVRRFASGFHHRHVDTEENLNPPKAVDSIRQSPLSVQEQELLIRFHARQIGQLVGPNAIAARLVRNSTVEATAIMLFRRFYMSNSALDFEPRKISVAAAYLASKVEEQRVELDLLERATALIERKFVKSSLGRQETYFVSAREIEVGERELMEGLNYEMRCHHPHAAIRVLAKEMSRFLSETASPRHVGGFPVEEREQQLYEKSIQVAQNALLSSDVSFLVSPGPIAFAAVATACRNGRKPTRTATGSALLEPEMKDFLKVRFPVEEEYDLRDFESQVAMVVKQLDKSPTMASDMLALCQTEEPNGSDHTSNQICEIRRVSCKVSALRVSREAERERCHDGRYQSPRKRKEQADEPLVGRVEIAQTKIPKVTPTRLSEHSA